VLAGNCIVEEAVLTGESTPQWKLPVGSGGVNLMEHLHIKSHRQHVLFGGTRMLQHTGDKSARLKTPDGGCLCVVLRTGAMKEVAGYLGSRSWLICLLCSKVAESSSVGFDTVAVIMSTSPDCSSRQTTVGWPVSSLGGSCCCALAASACCDRCCLSGCVPRLLVCCWTALLAGVCQWPCAMMSAMTLYTPIPAHPTQRSR